MGGGINPTPGALSLAHGGVLYLDEFPEFPRKIIESLRQPLEDGQITISRVHGNFVFQTDAMLVAAMNPCPCGYFPDRNRCKCTEHEVNKYLSKISGPMLDRIDICSQVDKIHSKDLQILREKHQNREMRESSGDIRKRIEIAREIQRDRFKNTGIRFNSQMNPEYLEKYCSMDEETCGILNNAYQHFGLSARAYHRILKVSRTISDLREEENITKQSVLEAISYKVPDMLVGR
jgi:magnesium chelatase family protein